MKVITKRCTVEPGVTLFVKVIEKKMDDSIPY